MLLKIYATIEKELLILWRDRAGMLVLFIMPAVLVVVMSLVQENILKIMGETGTQMLIDEIQDTQNKWWTRDVLSGFYYHSY